MDTVIPRLSGLQRAELARLGVVLCYLHGSLAASNARRDSDADIAVLFDEMPPDVIALTGSLLQALEGFAPGRELDIAILNEASPLFNQSVAAHGMCLYSRSEDDETRFQVRAMHEYEDSRHVAKVGRDAVLARLGI